jgi:hypothetical protein
MSKPERTGKDYQALRHLEGLRQDIARRAGRQRPASPVETKLAEPSLHLEGCSPRCARSARRPRRKPARIRAGADRRGPTVATTSLRWTPAPGCSTTTATRPAALPPHNRGLGGTLPRDHQGRRDITRARRREDLRLRQAPLLGRRLHRQPQAPVPHLPPTDRGDRLPRIARPHVAQQTERRCRGRDRRQRKSPGCRTRGASARRAERGVLCHARTAAAHTHALG